MADVSSPGTVTDGNVIENVFKPQVPLAEVADEKFDRSTKEEPKSEPAKPTEETPPSAPPSKSGSATDVPSDEGGYFADEGLEDESASNAQQPPQQPVTPPAQLPQNLTPQEQYVAQNIGQPITVRIKVGDQIQDVQAYSPTNLPAGYTYASDYDRDMALVGFNRLSTRAESLIASYENQQRQKQVDSFTSQEDRDIQKDIAWLQRSKV